MKTLGTIIILLYVVLYLIGAYRANNKKIVKNEVDLKRFGDLEDEFKIE